MGYLQPIGAVVGEVMGEVRRRMARAAEKLESGAWWPDLPQAARARWKAAFDALARGEDDADAVVLLAEAHDYLERPLPLYDPPEAAADFIRARAAKMKPPEGSYGAFWRWYGPVQRSLEQAERIARGILALTGDRALAQRVVERGETLARWLRQREMPWLPRHGWSPMPMDDWRETLAPQHAPHLLAWWQQVYAEMRREDFRL